MALHKSISD